MSSLTPLSNKANYTLQILEALCLSLQFNLASEIYLFTSTKPRFPDPLTVIEKINQLPLVTQFFADFPQDARVADIANAQMLVSTLGAVHALSNPLDAWQSIKGIFAFFGNRKGQLTPRLNEYIFKAIAATCAPGVAATVKEHVLQRSKQVKKGIRAQGGKKQFDGFGRAELALFVGTNTVKFQSLAEVNPLSVALNAAALDSHVQTYRIHRRNTTDMERGAKTMLTEMVNPTDDE